VAAARSKTRASTRLVFLYQEVFYILGPLAEFSAVRAKRRAVPVDPKRDGDGQAPGSDLSGNNPVLMGGFLYGTGMRLMGAFGSE